MSIIDNDKDVQDFTFDILPRIITIYKQLIQKNLCKNGRLTFWRFCICPYHFTFK